ncbi:MAG: asparagine synthase (glutamine-hydrolyzing) [Bacteroidia bacterium]|nr:asparagine synthase (glutamine-hydrolyzing) [Bacteroidia bacterium]
MCGLAGYYYFNGISETNSSLISEMLVLQKHRGPDDSGVLGINSASNVLEEASTGPHYQFSNNPDLVFGFNRLSILDLSLNGHQPMVHEPSKVALMLNGEVYNAFDYKDDLIHKGYRFKGKSDTEVVLYLYLEYGIEGMLGRLNGMFAICIFDGRNQKLYLIRDRFGIKPLYVFSSSDKIFFSSEIKSFIPAGIKLELNQTLLSEFLLFRNLINRTLFKGIRNVEPGTFLTIDRTGNINETRYYDLCQEGNKDSQSIGAQEWKDYLSKAVKSQLISDVKLGCQLSGGVDSSVVTAISSNYLPKGFLETVSVDFETKAFSEKNYIDHVVNNYSLVSHQFTLNSEMYFGLIDSSIWHFEQPLNHPNTIGIKLLSKNAREFLTVLLSGEGADELLGGYDRFLQRSFLELSYDLFLGTKRNHRKFSKWLSIWSNADGRYLLSSSFGSYNSLSQLYPIFSYDSAMESRYEYWKRVTGSASEKRRKYELLTFLPDLLVRQDKMSMAHSIENRVPFLDHELVSASFRLSDAQIFGKRNNQKSGKLILKDYCSELLGEEFAYRRKMGFSIPMRAFFTTAHFKERWDSELLPAIKSRGIFEFAAVQNWMQKPQSLTPDKIDAIWLMTGFEIWARKFLDGK